MSKKYFDKNTRVLFVFAALVGLMIGVTYASVPLYTLFCRATGYGGTVQNRKIADTPRSTTTATARRDRYVMVTFDGNVDPALPWDFKPVERSVKVKLGQVVTAAYHAHNRSDQTLTGTATFNVQPDKAGLYFDKVQCFCFTKQTLKAGEDANLSVEFYVDPEMASNRENDDVENITLSYTFFLAKNQAKDKQSAAP